VTESAHPARHTCVLSLHDQRREERTVRNAPGGGTIAGSLLGPRDRRVGSAAARDREPATVGRDGHGEKGDRLADRPRAPASSSQRRLQGRLPPDQPEGTLDGGGLGSWGGRRPEQPLGSAAVAPHAASGWTTWV